MVVGWTSRVYKARSGPRRIFWWIISELEVQMCDPKLFILTSLVVSNIFHLHPLLGERIHFDIFQMGWNHKLVFITDSQFSVRNDNRRLVGCSSIRIEVWFQLVFATSRKVYSARFFGGKNLPRRVSYFIFSRKSFGLVLHVGLGSKKTVRFIYFLGKKTSQGRPPCFSGRFCGGKIWKARPCSKLASNSSPNEFGNPTKSHQMNGVTY